MANWRVRTTQNDQSFRALAFAPGRTGGMVIRSPRGPESPTIFNQLESQRIIDYFGDPSNSYPDIYEALTYNQQHPLFIASAVDSGSYGLSLGIENTTSFVLESIVNLPGQLVSDPTSITSSSNFSSLLFRQEFDLDATDETFNFVSGSDAEYHTPTSIEIIGISAADNSRVSLSNVLTIANPRPSTLTFSFTGVTDTIFSSVSIDTTGAVDHTLVANADTSEYSKIYFEYSGTLSDSVAFIIATRARENRDVSIEITPEMTLSIRNRATSRPVAGFNAIETSFTGGAVDGYNNVIFLENNFEASDLFFAKVFSSTLLAPSTDSVTGVLNNGSRDEDVGASTIVSTLSKFVPDSHLVDVFFDNTRLPEVATQFSTMRGSISAPGLYAYSRFVVPTATGTAASVIQSASTNLPNNRGLAYYYSDFITRNPYNSLGSIRTSLMGSAAAMHAVIRSRYFGGAAPSWVNENGVGGQLTSVSIIENKGFLTDDETRLLDEARINPIVLNPTFGVMMISRRSGLSGSLGDYSFIDNVALVDYIIRSVLQTIIPYQIDKPNNSSYRSRVRSQAQALLSPLLAPPYSYLRELVIKCDGENNTDEVLLREEFVLDVGIKITPKSRIINFRITTAAQNVSVEEAIGGGV